MNPSRPFEFVLEALDKAKPVTKPMFGCHGVYVGGKIVLILRNKPGDQRDNGVWVATVPEHHASLKKELPSLRSIGVFGGGTTGWQIIPFEANDFEESAIRACDLILKGDPRIGKVPKPRKSKKKS